MVVREKRVNTASIEMNVVVLVLVLLLELVVRGDRSID